MTEAESLAGQCRATQDRFAATEGPLLVVHDTTELSYQREDGRPIGVLCKSHAGSDAIGRPRHQTVCGILMHSSLAVTTEGLPLGLAAMKFWTRRSFKGTLAPKRIEQKKGSVRWLENVRRCSVSTMLRGAHNIILRKQAGACLSFLIPNSGYFSSGAARA